MRNLYVQVVGWDKFQHYKDRRPTWIKNYVDLLRRDEYTDLTPGARAVLHGIWLMTASRHAGDVLRADNLSRDLNMRVTRAQLDSLEQAGFVALSASRSVPELPSSAPLEVEREEERETDAIGQEGPLAENVRQLFNPIIRKSDGTSPYTGCRAKRSLIGMKWVYDPLGTERPPKDWPHPTPTNEEIVKALHESRVA